jgi:hypothetical protein
MPSRLVIGALFVYGIVLGFFAFAFGAGGEGILGPLYLVVSPLAILLLAIGDNASPIAQAVGVGLLLVGSLQWGLLGLVQRWFGLKRIYSAGFLLLHYAFAAFLIAHSWADDAERWPEAKRLAMGYLVFGLVWYGMGQLLLWAIVVRGPASRSGSNRPEVAAGINS